MGMHNFPILNLADSGIEIRNAIVGLADDERKIVISDPPSDEYEITNIYWDGTIGKVVAERLTEPEP